MHADRHIVIIGALQTDFRLSFIDAALMKDPNGVLGNQEPNTPHPDMIRVTANKPIAKLEPAIESDFVETMGYAESGLRPPLRNEDIRLPDELFEAFESDPELADA